MLGIVALFTTACTIERVGPPGIVLTRPIRVRTSQVRVYETASMVPAQFSVVDDLDIKDDGAELPTVMEKRLRELAGGRGANAVILDPLNRKPNGTRVVTGLTLDDPFTHFRGTAIWVGDGPRPVTNLGTLGGKAQGCDSTRSLPVSLDRCSRIERRGPRARTAIAMPSMQETGEVAIYSEVCDVPAPMRLIGEIEVYNDSRERPAINRDLTDRAARSGANAIILHQNNRWAIGASYTSAEPNNFDPLLFSRAIAAFRPAP